MVTFNCGWFPTCFVFIHEIIKKVRELPTDRTEQRISSIEQVQRSFAAGIEQSQSMEKFRFTFMHYSVSIYLYLLRLKPNIKFYILKNQINEF